MQCCLCLTGVPPAVIQETQDMLNHHPVLNDTSALLIMEAARAHAITIGVGSGAPDEDIAVAQAGIDALMQALAQA